MDEKTRSAYGNWPDLTFNSDIRVSVYITHKCCYILARLSEPLPLAAMSTTETKQSATVTPSDPEKADLEHSSLQSNELSEVDLANYYEEKAGSLVVDPE